MHKTQMTYKDTHCKIIDFQEQIITKQETHSKRASKKKTTTKIVYSK